MSRWALLYRIAILALLAGILLELRELNGAPTLGQQARDATRGVTGLVMKKEEVVPGTEQPLLIDQKALEDAAADYVRRDRATASQPGR